jgi:hypothetical protein
MLRFTLSACFYAARHQLTMQCMAQWMPVRARPRIP